MIKKRWAIVLILIGLSFVKCKKTIKEKTSVPFGESKEELISRVFTFSERQYDYLIQRIENNTPLLQPRSATKLNKLNLVSYRDWTSGFFPGSLWYIYQYNRSDKWKTNAMKFTLVLDPVKNLTNTHDVGFMLDCSYGNAYLLTGNDRFKNVLIEGAESLKTRYNPVINALQSWDTGPDMGWISEQGWEFPVIIDNMMNLNLLYEAYKFTGDSTFYKVATSHALTTLHNHFRSDNSSFHVVDYDSKTGEVKSKVTAQGYSDSSSWARGQAWGLYGYTQTYENTKDSLFLNQAKGIANYIMENEKIPEDLIPYWDYDAPNIPNEPRDASAAAITASALFSLQKHVPPQESKAIVHYAEKIIRMLASNDYLTDYGKNQGFLLKHSVGNFHTDEENDKPLNYADYYFLEALLKWKTIN